MLSIVRLGAARTRGQIPCDSTESDQQERYRNKTSAQCYVLNKVYGSFTIGGSASAKNGDRLRLSTLPQQSRDCKGVAMAAEPAATRDESRAGQLMYNQQLSATFNGADIRQLDLIQSPTADSVAASPLRSPDLRPPTASASAKAK
jgi:hypothetical protein